MKSLFSILVDAFLASASTLLFAKAYRTIWPSGSKQNKQQKPRKKE